SLLAAADVSGGQSGRARARYQDRRWDRGARGRRVHRAEGRTRGGDPDRHFWRRSARVVAVRSIGFRRYRWAVRRRATLPGPGVVLGLEIGQEYLRGALVALRGGVRGWSTLGARATSVPARVADLVPLREIVCDEPGFTRSDITQTVRRGPSVNDSSRNTI